MAALMAEKNQRPAYLCDTEGSSEREIVDAKDMAARLQAAMTDLQQANGALKAKFDQVQSELDEAKATIKGLDQVQLTITKLGTERDAALSKLSGKIKDVEMLEGRVGTLEEEGRDASRANKTLAADVAFLTSKCSSLEVRLTQAEESLDMFVNPKGGEQDKGGLLVAYWKSECTKRVAHWKDECERQAVDLTSCKEIILNALRAGASGSSKPVSDEAGRGIRFLTTTLADKYLGLEYAIESTQKELNSARHALEKMRARLDEEEETFREKIAEMEKLAKGERHELVLVALASLHQLQSHLTVALKSVTTTANDAKFTFNRLKNRWGVQSNGRFDELVVKFDIPAKEVVRPPAGLQALSSRSPRVTRLRVHHPSRPQPVQLAESSREQGGLHARVHVADSQQSELVSAAVASSSDYLTSTLRGSRSPTLSFADHTPFHPRVLERKFAGIDPKPTFK